MTQVQAQALLDTHFPNARRQLVKMAVLWLASTTHEQKVALTANRSLCGRNANLLLACLILLVVLLPCLCYFFNQSPEAIAGCVAYPVCLALVLRTKLFYEPIIRSIQANGLSQSLRLEVLLPVFLIFTRPLPVALPPPR